MRQINIKNRTYYFFNGIASTQNFHSNLVKIGKKSYKSIDFYYIGDVAIKDIGYYERIDSVNPLYWIIGEVDGYIDENNGKKYLIFASKVKKY